MPSKNDWRAKRRALFAYLKVKDKREYKRLLHLWYHESKMSGIEISEHIFRITEGRIAITPKSIQRNVVGARSSRDSFANARSRGRVIWKKSVKPPRRPRIAFLKKLAFMRAADWTCSACGFREEDDANFSTLVIDHVKPLWEGGSDDESNLSVLCVPCHEKKTRGDMVRWREVHGSGPGRGGAMSGRDPKMKEIF